MAKKVYFGAGNRARRCRRIYVGVGDTARLVTHGYIGVNGIAQEFWSGGVLEYEGAAPDMTIGRYDAASTSLDGYALIGGGTNDIADIDIYSPSLVHTSAAVLSSKRYYAAATTVGGHTLFAGGGFNSGDSTADVVDSNFVACTPLALSTAKIRPAATTVGNWALILGDGVVDCISSQLIAGTPIVSSLYEYGTNPPPAAVTIGDHAVFAGFYKNGHLNTVAAYSSALVAASPAPLSVARTEIGAAANGEYALFAGGRNSNETPANIGRRIDVYDKNLTKRQNMTLKSGREGAAAASANGYMVFAGGIINGTYSASPDVDGFDSTLTAVDLPASAPRAAHTAAVAGDYILIAGGRTSNSTPQQKSVFAYCI